MELEFMTLANHAEEMGGLLYIHGGGWDTVHVHAPFPDDQPGVAPGVAALKGALVVRLQLHSTETERDHPFRIALLDADGGQVGLFEGSMRANKTLGLPAGWKQPMNLVLPILGIVVPKFDIYTFSLTVADHFLGEKAFRVLKNY